MPYAILKNNYVENVVVADKEYAEQQGWVEVDSDIRIGYQYINGIWVNPNLNQNILSQELAVSIRLYRNKLLTDTDWTQLSDSPIDKNIWAAYRQALRDIPQQSGFPENVVWPTEPNSPSS